MNRDNEEQKSIPQTFCGALQKEVNCKCLVLSVLIYGCLAAVTWCRCAIVTKFVTDYTPHPVINEKYVSPCDDGYIYIPVAFVGMLYLVYLVECYHSPIRIDLLHAESQNGVLAKLTQLKLAQPTIWWKAISYHYVRRKRQITRYRNGDNYTTTQVYYERVNTHAATSFYFYDYCGVKDISKDLILDPDVPITKITLTKGFAFSNVRSATEFEEARSRFFCEQEFSDDYMEMREGLDLGYNFNPITLVAVLGNPWFTNSYVYWFLSALLLSWPLRIIIEYKTQYVDYQITKLFGINYDTPSSVQIHTSASQLSAPGSYMLAPSYSEALLMDPTSSTLNVNATYNENDSTQYEIVPSYSEALLYERAQDSNYASRNSPMLHPRRNSHCDIANCGCQCHLGTSEKLLSTCEGQKDNDVCSTTVTQEEQFEKEHSNQTESQPNFCTNCSNCTLNLLADGNDLAACHKSTNFAQMDRMVREISEPNLRIGGEFTDVPTRLAYANGRSLANILENDEPELPSSRSRPGRTDASKNRPLMSAPVSTSSDGACKGAIPKNPDFKNQTASNMAESVKRMPASKTYHCLKSILKHNRRRYTLVTTEELQSLAHGQDPNRLLDSCKNLDGSLPEESTKCLCLNCRSCDDRDQLLGSITPKSPARLETNGPCLINDGCKRSRTLIFASPIQEICSSDPFKGRSLIASKSLHDSSSYEEPTSNPFFVRLKRPFTDKDLASNSRSRKYSRATSVDSATSLITNSASNISYAPFRDSPEVAHRTSAPTSQELQESAPRQEVLPTTSALVSNTDEQSTISANESFFDRKHVLRLKRPEPRSTSEPLRPELRTLRNNNTERIPNRTDNKHKNINMETSL